MGPKLEYITIFVVIIEYKDFLISSWEHTFFKQKPKSVQYYTYYIVISPFLSAIRGSYNACYCTKKVWITILLIDVRFPCCNISHFRQRQLNINDIHSVQILSAIRRRGTVLRVITVRIDFYRISIECRKNAIEFYRNSIEKCTKTIEIYRHSFEKSIDFIQ